VQGKTYGYAALDSNEVTYTGVPGTCTRNPYAGSTDCNGLWSNSALARMQAGLIQALGKLDSQIDWTQYDSDGDGFVDLVAFMPIGTVAHETGHGFGLPDLYDTDGSSEGVGEFSLMGSGNYTSPSSPSRMDAWSLNELGWVIVTPLTTGGPYTFGPAKPGVDTALFVPVGGSNPRGEYFLLENRQSVLSDGAMIRYHCQVWYASANTPTSS